MKTLKRGGNGGNANPADHLVEGMADIFGIATDDYHEQQVNLCTWDSAKLTFSCSGPDGFLRTNWQIDSHFAPVHPLVDFNVYGACSDASGTVNNMRLILDSVYLLAFKQMLPSTLPAKDSARDATFDALFATVLRAYSLTKELSPTPIDLYHAVVSMTYVQLPPTPPPGGVVNPKNGPVRALYDAMSSRSFDKCICVNGDCH